MYLTSLPQSHALRSLLPLIKTLIKLLIIIQLLMVCHLLCHIIFRSYNGQKELTCVHVVRTWKQKLVKDGFNLGLNE